MLLAPLRRFDFTLPLEDILMVDTIDSMRFAFNLMGCHFPSRLRKVQMAKVMAGYVRHNPFDVLRCMDSVPLYIIRQLIHEGKGGSVTLDEESQCALLQDMLLVVTDYTATPGKYTVFMLDELHDLFAPHIEEAYKSPSPVLEADMEQILKEMKDRLDNAKDKDAEEAMIMCEAMMAFLRMTMDDVASEMGKLIRHDPEKMSKKNLEKARDGFSSLLKQLDEARAQATRIATQYPTIKDALAEAVLQAEHIGAALEICRMTAVMQLKLFK